MKKIYIIAAILTLVLCGCTPREQKENYIAQNVADSAPAATQTAAAAKQDEIFYRLQEGMPEVYIFEQYGLWGLADADKNVIAAPRFKEMQDFIGDYAVCSITDYAAEPNDFSGYEEYPDAWGVIDRQGKIVVPFQYRWMNRQEDGTFRVTKGELEGIMTIDGRYIIEPKYYSLGDFVGGAAVVSREDYTYDEKGFNSAKTYYGLIDETGAELLPMDYDQIQLRQETGYVLVMANLRGAVEEYTITDGKLEKRIDGNTSIAVPESMTKICDDPELYRYEVLDLAGLADANRNPITEPVFAEIDVFCGEYAVAGKKDYTATPKESSGYLEYPRFFGVIDTEGETVVDFTYDSRITLSKDGHIVSNYFGLDENGKGAVLALIGSDGIPCEVYGYDGARYDAANDAFVADKLGGKYRVCVQGGEIVSEEQLTGSIATIEDAEPDWRSHYQEIVRLDSSPVSYLAKGLAGTWMLMDESGKPLEQGSLIEFKGFDKNGVAIYRIGAMYGLMARDGTLITQPRFSWTDVGFAQDRLLVKEDGKYGYVDPTGAYVVEPVYTLARGFYDGYARVWEEACEGLINLEGEEVLEPVYNSLEVYANGRIVVERAGKFGVADIDGNTLLEPVYEQIWGAYENCAEIETASGVGVVDYQGNALFEPVYDDFQNFDKNGIGRLKKGKYWAFVNDKGEMLTDFAYEELGEFFDGMAAVKIEGQYGYMGDDFRIKISPAFEQAFPFNEGYACVVYSSRYGVIDKQGNFVIEPRYERADYWGGGLVKLSEKEDPHADPSSIRYLEGVMHVSGKEILPIDYTQVHVIGEYGLIDANRETQYFHYYYDGETLTEVAALELGRNYYNGDDAPSLVLKSDDAVRFDMSAAMPKLACDPASFALCSGLLQSHYYLSSGDSSILDCQQDAANAIKLLWQGRADLLLMSEPDEATLSVFEESGLEVEMIPVAMDAFAMIANPENPVSDISLQQLRSVLGGKITDWSDLGADLGKIALFHDLESMEDAIMNGLEPVKTLGFAEMAKLTYRNLPNALGGVWLSRAASEDVKCLSIDGVEPSVENIRSGSYPFGETIYAVTLKDEGNPNVQLLIDWILSDAGQALARDAGFVSIR